MLKIEVKTAAEIYTVSFPYWTLLPTTGQRSLEPKQKKLGLLFATRLLFRDRLNFPHDEVDVIWQVFSITKRCYLKKRFLKQAHL